MKRPKFEVRLLLAAEKDFQEIIAYIAIDNPSAARSLAGKIEKRLSHLSAYPLIGTVPNERDLADMGYGISVFRSSKLSYLLHN